MVATRANPTPSPSKTGSLPPTAASTAAAATTTHRLWSHTPTPLILLWLAISLPLVAWDTGYVLLRPHSMLGGALHAPLWVPYALYGTVDYIYGFPALEARNGFTAAQASLNVVESVVYGWYLYALWAYGAREGAGLGQRRLRGRVAAWAVVVTFAAAVMTTGKTVLYGLNEHFSGWDNVGHNDVASLTFLWIIPNGAWIVVPSYMIYVFGRELVDGLAIASGEDSTASAKAVAGKDK